MEIIISYHWNQSSKIALYPSQSSPGSISAYGASTMPGSNTVHARGSALVLSQVSIVLERKFLKSSCTFDRFLIYCSIYFRQNAGAKSRTSDRKDTAYVVICEQGLKIVIREQIVLGCVFMLIKLKTYGCDLQEEGLGMFLRISEGRCPFKGKNMTQKVTQKECNFRVIVWQ